jgi:ABC-type multidrug transport system fused ATPase/permease subunit
MLLPLRQTWSLLHPRQRKRFWALSALVLVGTLLEVVGVSLVLPLLAVVSDANWVAKLDAVPLVGEWLATQQQARLLVLGISAILLVAVLKLAVLGSLAFAQSRFVGSVERSLSAALFESFLRRPWEYHIQRNSAELIQLSRVEVTNVAYAVTGFLNLLIDGTMIVGVLSLLAFAEPVAALVGVTLLSLTAAAFHYSTHERLERWGRERQAADTDRIRYLQQGFASVREISLIGCQEQFASQYEARTRAYVRVLSLQQFVQQMPRLGLEFVAILAVAAIAAAMSLSGRSVQELVPALGLFVAASARLAPSANRVLGSVQLIRWGTPSVAAVAEELCHDRADRDAGPALLRFALPATGTLRFVGVSYRYPGAERDALVGVSMAVQTGSIIGIIGASGSGKTTLMDILLGLIRPSSGTVRLGEADIHEHLPQWRSRVGYVPQSIQLIDDSLRRNVAFGVKDPEIDEIRVWEALRQARLEAFVRALPAGLDTRIGEDGSWLSGGQRQRLGIARALYRDPGVLVLDEATSALDAATETEVMQTVIGLRGLKTVVIVAHRLSTLKACDKVFRLDGGLVVAEGCFEEVVGSSLSGP